MLKFLIMALLLALIVYLIFLRRPPPPPRDWRRRDGDDGPILPIGMTDTSPARPVKPAPEPVDADSSGGDGGGD